jgi:hypothetical protein
MSGNKVQDSPKPKGPKCGAKTKTSGGKCQRPAGWGTNHSGSGKCKLHGGASTGPRSEEGKKKIAANAIKHGAYSDKLLSEQERELYSVLWDHTIIKHTLDQEDPMQMATLQRACITYIKLIRLDEWEMEEEILATVGTQNNPKTGEEELVGQNVYDLDGEIVGKRMVILHRIKGQKLPNWEGHFQRYMAILGVDRGTQIKMAGAQQIAGTMADAVSWLWGGKSLEQ